MDPHLEKAFLAELEALEKFRVSYSGMYPEVPLASEDPDVRRLLEALALFTARTRLAAERNVGESLLRIFRQHFPYLLSPVPAMLMLRAVVTRRYVDVSALPRGSEVNLVKSGGGDASDETYRFRTMAPMRILPIELEGVETFVKSPRAVRLALRFTAVFPRNDEVGELSLHIDYLNDLHSSLLVMHELKTHLVGASVRWSHKVDAATTGEPCQVRFGAHEPEDSEADTFDHPLQRIRAALHFPQQELFVRVSGLRAPRNWQHFTIFFDLDEQWPANLRLNPECFQLHVVPIENVRRDAADAILHDGTQERHVARHPDRSLAFVPLAVHAAYRKTDQGLVPLEPAIAGTNRESFEALVEGNASARKAWITLALPNAFDAPETVLVDAFWHQPAVSERRASDFDVQLGDRFVDGIHWSSLGPLVPHADALLDEDREGMLQLLSIKGQRLLGLDELRFLLRAFGVPGEKPFAKFGTHLAEARIVQKPLVRRANGFKHIYELVFRDLTPSDVPRLNVFCAQVLRLLAAWSVDEVIELVVRVPNLEREFRYA